MISTTRNSLTFVDTTTITYTKVLRLQPAFCPDAITVVFTNVRELRVACETGNISGLPTSGLIPKEKEKLG